MLGFNLSAKFYKEHAKIQKLVAENLCNLIPKFCSHNSILDIGCGDGFIFSHKLLSLYKGKTPNYIQIDLSLEMCNIAKASNSCSSINCDMHKMPFSCGAFDLIVSSMALQWSYDIEIVISEIARILKNGCTVAVALPIDGTFSELEDVYNQIFAKNFKILTEKKMQSVLYSADYIKTLFTKYFIGYNINFTEIRYIEYFKTFRNFALNIKLTGAYFLKRENINVFEISRLYEKKYKRDEKIPVSWNILYITIKSI